MQHVIRVLVATSNTVSSTTFVKIHGEKSITGYSQNTSGPQLLEAGGGYWRSIGTLPFAGYLQAGCLG